MFDTKNPKTGFPGFSTGFARLKGSPRRCLVSLPSSPNNSASGGPRCTGSQAGHERQRAEGEEQKLFYALLGQAVEHWSQVEDALCDVFVASIGIDPTDEDNCTVGAAGFYAVLSFEAKLSMTHATVCARFQDLTLDPPRPHPLRVRWLTLHNRAINGGQTRNKLAHYQARTVAGTPGHRFELRPRNYGTDNTSRFRLNELRGAVRTFSRLTVDLTAFADSIPT